VLGIDRAQMNPGGAGTIKNFDTRISTINIGEHAMAAKPQTHRYVIMPKDGFEHPALKSALLAPIARPVTLKARAEGVSTPEMRVIDSIDDTGPKLVETTAEGELSLRLSNPELKVVPEVFYYRLWYRPVLKQRHVAVRRGVKSRAKVGGRVKLAAKAAAIGAGTSITVVDAKNGKPLRGAHVVAFTDYVNRVGDQGDSGANGVVSLRSISARQPLERVYIYAPPGYWDWYKADTTATALKTVKLRAIDLQDPTLLLHQLYGGFPANAGEGVVVGVIDSGVDGHHPNLPNVAGGLNCVGDELRSDPGAAKEWGPARTEGEHGTHVAGIIGARSGNQQSFHGVAPGVTLRSYRVFPNDGGGASNFDIARAIDAATREGCDLINMSLGGGPADDLTKAAIDRAIAAGVVVIAAAGNDGRQPVSYPAAFAECVSVSAMGRKKSFPADSIGVSDIAKPTGGQNGRDFIADFSNIGSQIDCTGAGVEIVSTLPDGGHGAMSGTSMATPAVTGFAAYLLAVNPAVKALTGTDRSRKLKDLLYASCKPEGFGRDYEGFGLPL
jgi:subtilisin